MGMDAPVAIIINERQQKVGKSWGLTCSVSPALRTLEGQNLALQARSLSHKMTFSGTVLLPGLRATREHLGGLAVDIRMFSIPTVICFGDSGKPSLSSDIRHLRVRYETQWPLQYEVGH